MIGAAIAKAAAAASADNRAVDPRIYRATLARLADAVAQRGASQRDARTFVLMVAAGASSTVR